MPIPLGKQGFYLQCFGSHMDNLDMQNFRIKWTNVNGTFCESSKEKTQEQDLFRALD